MDYWQMRNNVVADVATNKPVNKSWFISFMAAFFVVWIVRATLLYSIDLAIPEGAPRQIYSDVLRVTLWVLPVFAYLQFIDRVPALAYLKLNSRSSRKALLEACALIVAYFTVSVILEYLVKGRTLFHPVGSERLMQIALGLPCAPVAEEILFRGFVLRKIGSYMTFWKANLITALLFTSVHWPNWLFTKGFQSEVAINSVSVFILACFLGFLVRKTNSLWPAIGAHALNNLISFLLA